MAKEAKTNAMRMLERQKVPYQVLTYECEEFIDGMHSADLTGALRAVIQDACDGGQKQRTLCLCDSH